MSILFHLRKFLDYNQYVSTKILSFAACHTSTNIKLVAAHHSWCHQWHFWACKLSRFWLLSHYDLR